LVSDNTNPVQRTDDYEVISLYDLISILLKRKLQIFLVFFLCVILAVAGSLMMKPVYRVASSIYPGWISTDNEGRPISVESAENIKSTIEKDSFLSEVYSDLGWSYDGTNKFSVSTEVPGKSNLIYLYVDSDVPEKAQIFLETLLNKIREFYSPRSQLTRDSITQEMLINANTIDILKERELTIKLDKDKINNQIALARGRLDVLRESSKRLQEEILKIKNNTSDIIALRDQIIKNQTGDDALVVLLYSSTIQQNLSFLQHLYSMIENNNIQQLDTQKEVDDLLIQLQEKDLQGKELRAEQENAYAKGQQLKLKKNKIEGLQVISKPVILPERVKPNRTLMVALAGVLGLFLGVFVAFFREFWENQKELRAQA
jgi:LPS O-antigen subunit length determinant protein (WzzB/FepE family)